MFKLTKSSTEPLTPAMATSHRDLPGSPTERKLQPGRLAFLTDRFVAGLTVPFNWAVAELGEQRFRMNGMHSATSLSALVNGAFPQGAQVHLDIYQCESREDLALLFRQFDARQSSRSSDDVSGAYQGLEPALQHVSGKVAKLCAEAIIWYRVNIEGLPKTLVGDDRYKVFAETGFHPWMEWTDQVLNIKTPEMKKVPISAAMLATFEANEQAARAFWPEVAQGGILDNESAPSSRLDDWLRRAKETNLGDGLKPAHYFQGCIFAWNAQREGKALKDIRFDVRKGFYHVED